MHIYECSCVFMLIIVLTRLTYFNANINSIRIKRDWSFLCISHEKCYMYDELWLIM